MRQIIFGNTKVDIENGKVDIQDKKVDIESVLSEKGSNFSVKTTVHIHRLFEKFGFDEVFGRSAVMELPVLWDLLGICHLHLC